MRFSEFKNLIANMPIKHQAFTSKRATWATHIEKDDKVGSSLRSIFQDADKVTLSRSDLKSLSNNSDMTDFVIATIIWGYPRGQRGNHFTDLIGQLDTLTQLLNTAKNQPITDWDHHFEKVRSIKGLGLSTYTKFLCFLSVKVNSHKALILDERIIRVANHGVFEDMMPLRHLTNHNAARSYPDYLYHMEKIASMLSVSPEQLELFLFQFGLNMKQPM